MALTITQPVSWKHCQPSPKGHISCLSALCCLHLRRDICVGTEWKQEIFLFIYVYTLYYYIFYIYVHTHTYVYITSKLYSLSISWSRANANLAHRPVHARFAVHLRLRPRPHVVLHALHHARHHDGSRQLLRHSPSESPSSTHPPLHLLVFIIHRLY